MTPEKTDLEALLNKSLDAATDVTELADAAQFSVAHTYRLFEKSGHGSPMRVRRRLLLERSAWELIHTKRAVTEIAFDATYDSLEGFSRAFRAAYGISPSMYRRYAPSDFRLGLAGLHYAPVSTPIHRRQGNLSMTLLDLLLNEHFQNTNLILDVYEGLPDEQRDIVLPNTDPFPWEPDDLSVRQLVSRLCGFGEPWIHQLDDEPGSTNDGTLSSLRAQLVENDRRFRDLANKIQDEGSWDLTFVDSECEPPEVFNYGLVVTMQIVYTSHARVTVEHFLRRIGHPVTFV